MSIAMSAANSQQSHASSASNSSSYSNNHNYQYNYSSNYSSNSSSSSSFTSNHSAGSSTSSHSQAHLTYPSGNTTAAAEWTQPFEVDDADITFDGQPLSKLLEKEHSGVHYAPAAPRKEERRGRKKRREGY